MTRNTCFKFGITVGRMENKEVVDSITLNLSGITNSICGVSDGNETTSSSIIVESSTNLKVASTTWPTLVGQNVSEATLIEHTASWR